MNRYDEAYDFMMATMDDVDEVMEFYDRYWPGNKIMGKDKKYLLWQYTAPEKDRICILLARSKVDGSIVGVDGYVPAGIESEDVDIWGCGILVATEKAIPMLGMEMDKRLPEFIKYRNYLTLGLREGTMFLAKKVFGKRVGYLKHYYRINEDIDVYKLAVVNDWKDPEISSCSEAKIVKYEFENQMNEKYDDSDSKMIPNKSKWYIRHHYYEHPIYKYDVYGIELDGNCKALFVCRCIEHDGSRALRVVDYIGKPEYIALIGDGWDRLMHQYDAEYMDFYALGFDDEDLKKIGFVCRSDDTQDIVPNWFEPFVRENKNISFGLETDENVVLCKADADMDRPNWGYY